VLLRLTPKRDLHHKSFSGPNSALLRRLPDDELAKWTARWAARTAERLAGERELRRRENWPTNFRAWISLGISLVALTVSIVAYLSR
jgi:hypothetical protein